MSLKIKSLSYNSSLFIYFGVVLLELDSTNSETFLYFYILQGPAQKVPPQNKWTKFYLKDEYTCSLNSYRNYYNTLRNKNVIEG